MPISIPPLCTDPINRFPVRVYIVQSWTLRLRYGAGEEGDSSRRWLCAGLL